MGHTDARLTNSPDRCSASIAALRYPPKNSVGPDALGVPGPCFAARETSENLQMISQRRKRLAFAPAASDVRFSDCVKRLFRSGIGAATALRPQSRWGHALWSGGVMATPTFCHALATARRLRRLDSLALCCGDVRTFSPEHGPCQIKFFRWSQRPMRQNEARPGRRHVWTTPADQGFFCRVARVVGAVMSPAWLCGIR